MEEITYLYLICGLPKSGEPKGPCKIGITNNPAGRLRGLATANPCKLIIYDLFDFDDRAFCAEAEKLAHYALAKHRMSGEWFDVDPEHARQILNLWFWMAAKTGEPEGKELAMPPMHGMGMVPNGRADQRGRIL